MTVKSQLGVEEPRVELSKQTLRHYLHLRQHRSTLLAGMSRIAIRHINHVMGAMSRLGFKVLNDDQSVERTFDLIYDEQGMSADRNSRPIVEFINTIPWEMYLCLLYVELQDKERFGARHGVVETRQTGNSPRESPLKIVWSTRPTWTTS